MRTLTALITMSAALMTFASLGPTPARAGTQDGAVVALHVTLETPTAKNICTDLTPVGQGIPCRDFVNTAPLNTGCHVYLVVARAEPGPGIAALSCGIQFNHGETGEATATDGEGVDLYAFTFCASGLEFPTPPDDTGWTMNYSGAGRRITWDAAVDCQTTEIGDDGVHTVAGVFYLFAYDDDLFEITPNRTIDSSLDEFQVGDCDNNLTDLLYPAQAGAVAFGAGLGRNPCQAIPVRPLSWSRLKTTYKQSEDPQ